MVIVKIVIVLAKLVKIHITVLHAQVKNIGSFTISNVYVKRDIMNLMVNVLNLILLLHLIPLQMILIGDA